MYIDLLNILLKLGAYIQSRTLPINHLSPQLQHSFIMPRCNKTQAQSKKDQKYQLEQLELAFAEYKRVLASGAKPKPSAIANTFHFAI